MADIRIAFINESSLVTDKEVKKVMNALQVQVSRDFSKAWGIDAKLFFYSTKQKAPDDYWWLVILDHPDEADACGYHDLTPKGLPMGKIFPKIDMDNGDPWSSTASHELLEMLGDPGTNLMVSRFSGRHGNILYAYEVCDPCQDNSCSYRINGVVVSNFVYPNWFVQINHPRGTRFDHLGKIKQPFELLEGGYITINRVNNKKGWVDIEEPMQGDVKSKRKTHAHTRRARRRVGRKNWKLSTKKAVKGKKRK